MKLGWTTVTLGEVADIERRGVDPASLAADTAYLGLEHIESGGRIIGRSTVGDSAVASTKFRFGPEHVLFGKLRPYLAKIAAPDFNGVCSTDILPIRPKPLLHARYLEHFLRQPVVVDLASARATGANLPRLSPAELARFELPLPPIEEQRRIAAILDHADQLVRMRQKTLGEANRLLNGAVHRALAASGTSVPLKELADVRIGPFGSLLHREDYVEGGVPLINPMHIVAGRLQADPAYSVSDDKAAQLDRYRLREGDVVMGRRGEMGRCARVLDSHDGFLCGTGSLIIRPRPGRSRSTYLQCVLSAPRTVRSLESRALGMTLPNLNSKIMEELPIPNLPLDDQRDLEARVEQIDSLKAVMTVQATALSRMFTSLQARAFSGRL